MGELLKRNILAVLAAVFYLGYTAALVYFAVRPDQPDITLLNVALTGLLIGLIAYGTYDMTKSCLITDQQSYRKNNRALKLVFGSQEQSCA